MTSFPNPKIRFPIGTPPLLAVWPAFPNSLYTNKYVLLFYDARKRIWCMKSEFDTEFGLFSARAPLPLAVQSATGIESNANVDASAHRRLEQQVFFFAITAGMNNETFSEALCAAITSASYSELSISNPPQLPLALPSCVATSGGSSIHRFVGYNLLIDNWSHLPPSLSLLSCMGCRFAKNGGGDVSNDGWDSNGMVSWPEVFAHMPTLERINLPNNVLPALLPTSLPASILNFDVRSCGLTGTISSTFLSTSSVRPSLQLFLQGNQISGTIPSNLFSPLQSSSMLTLLRLYLSNNNLAGSLPAGFLDPLADKSISDFDLLLNDNYGLSGSIPTNLIPSSTLGTSSFYLRLGNTNISGPIPEGFFSRLAQTSYFDFSASGTQITGPLPSNLFGENWAPENGVTIDLSNSKLNGTIPPGFISGNLQLNHTVFNLFIQLHNNDLEGSIPSNLLWNEVITTKKDSTSTLYTTSKMQSQATNRASIKVQGQFELKLSGNRLIGTIPAELISESFPQEASTMASIDLSNNLLTGTISPSFLPSIVSVTFNAANNQLSGSLPPCPIPGPIATTNLLLQLQNNFLSGSIPQSWEECKFTSITLNANVGLNGTIPPSLFNSTGIAVFNAANTSLDGELPPVRATTLRTLTLTNTKLDFCSPSSIASVNGFVLPLRSCDVQGTSACDCVEVYIPCFPTLNDTCPILVPSEPVVTPQSTPVESPTSPPFNVLPAEVPSSPLIPTPQIVPSAPTAPSPQPIHTPTSSGTSCAITHVLLALQCALTLLVWL